MSKIPKAKPQLSVDAVDKIIAFKKIDRKKYPVVIVGVRGYFMNSMGKVGVNDRGLFDDSGFVRSPSNFTAVNFNTDPSGYRKGKGFGAGKGMACLKEGTWLYKIGPHKGRSPALRQAAPVTVIRDGSPPYEHTGDHAINHHWGSSVGTSSAGCQTVPPAQWPSYIGAIVTETKRYGQKVIPYILISEAERKKILEVVPEPVQTDAVAHNFAPAVELIKEFEGFRSKAYLCPAGVWTIGYGTTRDVKKGDTCTKEQGEAWLVDDIIHERFPVIDKAIKVPLSVNQICALISFVYNVGNGAFAKSTLVKMINAKASKAETAAEFHKWNKGGGRVLAGLVRRRKAEAALFVA